MDDHRTVQFQIPNFVLGGTPSLAHGGGAEVLPGMYGQGPQVWSEYDKYWYDQNHQSKDYALADLVVNPPSSPGRVHMTPRPFEFDPPPVAASPSPGITHERVLPLATGYTLPSLNFLDPTASLPPLPPNGLPLYSASGFDMLRMLAKVATRPNPKIMLGPVDMTCSFVVVDVRRLDAPIVYASPTFTRLTGYSESEVLGRNCRFLQHPSGQIHRGDPREFTAPDAVRHLHKALLQDKECQASLINYRKDGSAFINLVTVIPISAPEDEHDGESGEITHCVGFQVDLAEQPNAILQKLRDGSYIVNYSSVGAGPAGLVGGPVYGLSLGAGMGRERRGKGVSAEMIDLLHSARAYLGARPGAQMGGFKGARDSDRADLHSLLLENTDDFIYVVSLKGALLYVAPAVTRVLGHNPADLVGKSIADLCHPADVVPLMRELKDASSGPGAHGIPAHHGHAQAQGPAALSGHAPLFVLQTPHHASAPPPKPVHLLFRAQCKLGTGGIGYAWLEARGRLHVEQGKGRKAIVLVGRRVGVPSLTWGALRQAQARDQEDLGVEVDECWGLVAPNGIVLSASPKGAQRLGYTAPPPPSPSSSAGAPTGASSPIPVPVPMHLWPPGDPQTLVGRSLTSLVVPGDGRRVGEVLADAACLDRDEVRWVRCRMRVCARTRGQAGMVESVPVEMRFFAQKRERDAESGSGCGEESSRSAPSLPPSLVFQMVFLDEMAVMESGGASALQGGSVQQHALSLDAASSPSYTLRSILQGPSPSVMSMKRDSMDTGMVSPSGTSDGTGAGRPFSRTSQPAHANILAELSTAAPSALASTSTATLASSSPSSSTAAAAASSISDPSTTETSWQYELTRLRFENERMREEVRRLERVRRGLGVARVRGTRGRAGASASASMMRGGLEEGMSSSLSVVATDVSHAHEMGTGMGMGIPLLPSGVPLKRTREGEMKRPLT